MRCSEIRRRINNINSDLALDKDLQNHISTCQKCAMLVKAELDLRKSFTEAGVSDDLEIIPWSIQKNRAEAEADQILQQEEKGFNIMKTISKQFTLRPKLSVSLCVGLALLLLITMIPFKIERSMGYEVAIAGVNKDLAMDSEKITKLLKAIGCDDASFNLGDCEATCELKISELKSEDEVKIVVAAFDKMGNCIVEEITSVDGVSTNTLLNHAKNKIKIGNCNFNSVDAIHQDDRIRIQAKRIIADLSDDSGHEFTIWTSVDADSNSNVVIKNICNTDSIKVMTSTLISDEGERTTITAIVNGEKYIIPIDGKNMEQKLIELGMNAEIAKEIQDGILSYKIVFCDSTNSAAKSSTPEELPEGYLLEQNYPNPFNPTTNISFNIPSAQHVTLEVINVLGQRVKSLVDEELPSGRHTVEWDATNENGNRVSSGMYFYRLITDDVNYSKKMTLLK